MTNKNHSPRKREVMVGGQKIDLQILEQMDDNTLRQAIAMIARATGANEKQVQRAASNIQMMKRRLAGMSGEEIQQAVDSAPPDQAEEIVKILRQSNARKEEEH